ncbi:hypothetical protein A5893_01870 [Pedobacter psychrophilus]|uniref:Uncharacterized protein n=1 Tax=Pedobacter psychrophilus TaxID=1826909 RepID=A0A179DMX9_9SPHI|nr:hypothetical protein [Pedobacter psychrophilus]OAQ41889.1 hypothetical protein A5893_01870 [Pedobacter psychrophilus]
MVLNEKLSLKNRIHFTVLVILFVWLNLIWDYFHTGVPTHHILQREDLPGVSNWWGGLAVPLISWFLLIRIAKRVNIKMAISNIYNPSIYTFLGSLFFGIILSFFFTISSNITGYMMIGLIFLSFFIQLYKAEFLLGFIIGMTYTFGGILPIAIGSLLIILFTINYKLVRYGVLYILSKVGLRKDNN